MTEEQQSGSINYERLVEEALRMVVKGALNIAQRDGLGDDSHFYITFATEAKGVFMSDALRQTNPKEITIVLQHQFWDLHVEDDYFSVTLSFSGVHHNLTVPYAAISHFTDPAAGFGLQFSISSGQDNFESGDSEKNLEGDNFRGGQNLKQKDKQHQSVHSIEEGAKRRKNKNAAKTHPNHAPKSTEKNAPKAGKDMPSKNMPPKDAPPKDTQREDSAEIVSLDRFRNKGRMPKK